MGGGYTPKQERDAKAHQMRKIRNELKNAGVSFVSDKGTVFLAGKFMIGHKNTLRASNGEAFLHLSVAIIDPDVGSEEYFLLNARDGIERVKALYGDEEHRKNRPYTEIVYKVILVERAVLKSCETLPREKEEHIFLHDVDGCRVSKNEGMIFAYNQMRDGKPMLRLGCCSADYVEFRPGMSARWGDGRLVVQM
jgi:ribosomal protein S19E (S16A)